MDRININLNPKKENIAQGILENLTSYTPFVGIAVLIVLVLFFLLQLGILKKSHTNHVYSKKWKEWEERSNLIIDLKAEIAKLESEKGAFDSIAEPTYNMPLIFENIFSSLPKNVWFRELSLKENSLNLNGYVVIWQEDPLVSLDSFINLLRQNEYFSSKFIKISIKESPKTRFKTVEVLEFSIECRS